MSLLAILVAMLVTFLFVVVLQYLVFAVAALVWFAVGTTRTFLRNWRNRLFPPP